jgi:hypothetical protein
MRSGVPCPLPLLAYREHRWAQNRTDDIQAAFFNGIGFESWENVWGSWNGITPVCGVWCVVCGVWCVVGWCVVGWCVVCGVWCVGVWCVVGWCVVGWCVVCGVWCVVCGVWCVVCGVWCVVCGVWCVVCGVWCVVCVPPVHRLCELCRRSGTGKPPRFSARCHGSWAGAACCRAPSGCPTPRRSTVRGPPAAAPRRFCAPVRRRLLCRTGCVGFCAAAAARIMCTGCTMCAVNPCSAVGRGRTLFTVWMCVWMYVCVCHRSPCAC